MNRHRPSRPPSNTIRPVAGVLALSIAVLQTPAISATFSATPIAPSQRLIAEGAITSRLARTDPTLLERQDATPIPVMVKLDYDPIATYGGHIRSLPATSPAVTRRKIDRGAQRGAYARWVETRETAIVGAIRRRFPKAKIGTALRVVYGGVALTLPANEVKELVKVDGVIAVQPDELNQPTTDSSPAFLNTPPVWDMLGGQATAGAGVLFGSLDFGAWPEHPSYAANPDLPPAPTDTLGAPIPCDFGDNPLTPATDVFQCNNKLVGGRRIMDTYDALANRPEVYTTARDSDGHGTHTSTTAAGNPVSATLLGIPRGSVSGIAPGAAVIVYKVCGSLLCYDSDLAAAVQRAILDGVDVINFSISGGQNPYTHPVELAFLDAYAAGVVVVASAGNDGPAAGTTDHHGPWTTTVAASTQRRIFESSLTLSSGGDTLVLPGASVTAGVGAPLPVVLASAPPYSRPFCDANPPPGLFAGKILVCQTTNVASDVIAFNGGAAGLIKYDPNPAPAHEAVTFNAFVPTVHVVDGPALAAFLSSHGVTTATFTQGTPMEGTPDVVTTFSSRGPGGPVMKPDLAAPGTDILAGHTPTPENANKGPSGNLFRTLKGTSMAAPHVAGAAILMRAAHPTWTPGQVRSALMTTATPAMLDFDESSPANPFVRGAGRIDVQRAVDARITFDETAARFADVGAGTMEAVDLNLPSIYVPVMPGSVTTTRTAANTTAKKVTYKVTTTAAPGSTITVAPKKIAIPPNASKAFTVTIESTNQSGQEFGEIVLTPSKNGGPVVRIPVAFVPQQGGVTLASECTPADIVIGGASTTCSVVATNTTETDTTVSLTTEVSNHVKIVSAAGGLPFTAKKIAATLPIPRLAYGTPSIAPGSAAGYLPLDAFGVTPTPIGDEELLNFDTDPFVYGGLTYSRVGVSPNGYAVVGGGDLGDNTYVPSIPNAARPNNVLAPLWADLDGTGRPGIYFASLTDGVRNWTVIEWRVNAYATTSLKVFQLWLGNNGTQDITFAYDPANLPSASGLGQWVTGAENADGSAGATLAFGMLPTQDHRITSSQFVLASTVLEFTAQPKKKGTGVIATEMATPLVRGTTAVTSTVNVTKP